MTVTTDPGEPFGTAFYEDPVLDDNADFPPILSSTRQSGQIFIIGETTVTHTAFDLAGNRMSCTHTITVNDEEPPVLVCPPNMRVATDPGLPTAQVTYRDPEAAGWESLCIMTSLTIYNPQITPKVLSSSM